MSNSEFRRISGTVVMQKDGSATKTIVGLWMFGAMPFLFVETPAGHWTHLLPNNTFGTLPGYRWDGLWIGEAYRLEPHTTVVAAIDIARETAKRLGVGE